MIIDSSAICAILLNESDADHYEEAVIHADVRRMSAGSLLETAMVIEGRAGLSGGDELDAFIERHAIEIVPVTPEQVAVARHARGEVSARATTPPPSTSAIASPTPSQK